MVHTLDTDAIAFFCFFNSFNNRLKAQLDAIAIHLFEQHADDLTRRPVAKELAEGLFVIGDAVTLNHGHKVFGRVAP